MEKPYSAASERNQGPILEVLLKHIHLTDRRVLEIGSGTGQHAIHFAPHFPQVEWFPTDLSDKMLGLNMNLKDARTQNIQKPQRLDVSKDDFPKLKFDVVFTANTLHIMNWKDCKSFMKLLGHRLRENSRAIFYGPFKYKGEFSSDSDAQFDLMIKERDPLSGIRSFEDIFSNMTKNGFELIADYEMPANNRTLVFNRLKFVK